MVSNPNIELVAQGLSREDLFTIVHDVYMTPTCEYADIILPAPTGFEYEEFNGGYGHNYDVVSPQVIEPLGECKDNNEVCNLLGAAMGFTDEAFTRDKQWYRNLFLEGKAYTWEEISQAGWVDVPPTTWEAQLEAGYGTPSAKFQFACDELEANHGTRTVRYVPDEESINGDAELLAKYPISLLTPSAKEFLNGVMGNLADNNALFFENYVYLNQEDASERGIADGDAVRVFNDRGSVNRVARVIDGITSVKTAYAYKSTWYNFMGESNINVVTTDARADIGRGVAFMSSLVEIEKA